MNTYPLSSPAESQSPFDSTFSSIGAPVRSDFNPFDSTRYSGAYSPQVPEMPWTTPLPESSSNPFTGFNRSGSDIEPSNWDQGIDQRPTIGERVHEKARVVKELAKRAISAIGMRMPKLERSPSDSYDDNYGRKVSGFARSAAKETAMAAAFGGAQALGERYGLGYEDGRVTVESKRKLAKGAFRLLRMPQAEALGALRDAGTGMYTAGRHEAFSQVSAARDVLTADARMAMQGAFSARTPFGPTR